MRRFVKSIFLLFLGSLASQSNAHAEEADFSQVPGVVIAHRPASKGIYIGSPGMAVLPDGSYLAKLDEFGPKSSAEVAAVTQVYRSTDQGGTWQEIAKIDGMFWATLFIHRGDAYLLGTDREYGNVVIRRSTDGGRSWTEPQDATSGLLLAGGQFHGAPVPVIVHDGRLWRGMEDAGGEGGWGAHFRAFVMSAPEDADLLQAQNWTHTNRIARDPRWLNGDFSGWLEGNAVVTPQDQIVDILRISIRGLPEKAAIVRVSSDGKTATFDPESGFVELPGAAKKFTIRFDPNTRKYWSITNPVLSPYKDQSAGGVRNTVALISSSDLHDWQVNCILLHHPDTQHHGFQYIDWLFEGDDIIAVSRTAFDDGLGGAHNFHDANFLTFHRIDNFRELTMDDSVPSPAF